MESVTDYSDMTPSQLEESIAATHSAISEKVEALKEGVEETVKNAEDAVLDGVEEVRKRFTITHQVRQQPWLCVAAAVGIGTIAGTVVGRGVTAAVATSNSGTASASENFHGTTRSTSSFGEIGDFALREFKGIKATAVDIFFDLFREVAKASVPAPFTAKAASFVDAAKRSLSK